MKSLCVMVIILTVGCGRFEDSSGEASDEGSPGSGSAKTLAIDTKSELPECNENNENQLAYVKNESYFYECEENEWAKIRVQSGDWPENAWVDSVTGYVWLVGGLVTWTYAYGELQSDDTCTGDWVNPSTDDEIKMAGLHGLDAEPWLLKGESSNRAYYLAEGTSSTLVSRSEKHHVLCVLKE